jgi:hypothetical protein
MEWIEALSREKLISLTREFGSSDPKIGLRIREFAKLPIEIDKSKFFFEIENKGLESKSLWFNVKKARKWVANSNKHVLTNQVAILKFYLIYFFFFFYNYERAVSEAVCDSILLNQSRPPGSLFNFYLYSFYYFFLHYFINISN